MLTLHTITIVAALVTCHTRQLSQGSGYVTICEPPVAVELPAETALVDASVSDDPEDATYEWQSERCEPGDPLCTDLYGSVSFVGGGK